MRNVLRLTPYSGEERNKVLNKAVHTKVIQGEPFVMCRGILVRQERAVSPTGASEWYYWHCVTCHVEYVFHQDIDSARIQGPHNPKENDDEVPIPLFYSQEDSDDAHIPDYSRDWNSAWLVLLAMVQGYKWFDKETYTRPFLTFADTLLCLGEFSSSDELYPASKMFSIVRMWTPETICLAALEAVGVEVLQ